MAQPDHIAEELMVAWLHGKLGAGEKNCVVAHLERCGECGQRASSLKQLDKLLQGVRLAEAPRQGCLDADLVAAYSQGALRDERAQRVEAHLARCDGCLEDLIAAQEAAEVQTEAPANNRLVNRLFRLDRQRGAARPRKPAVRPAPPVPAIPRRLRQRARRQRVSLGWLPYAAAAALVLFAFLVVLVLEKDEPAPQTAPPDQAAERTRAERERPEPELARGEEPVPPDRPDEGQQDREPDESLAQGEDEEGAQPPEEPEPLDATDLAQREEETPPPPEEALPEELVREEEVPGPAESDTAEMEHLGETLLLTQVRGEAWRISKGVSGEGRLYPGARLESSDIVYTWPYARAYLQVEGAGTVAMNANTRLQLAREGADFQASIAMGQAFFDLEPREEGTFEVLAAGVRIEVLFTQFEVTVGDEEVTCSVHRGKVRLYSGEGERELRRGSYVSVVPGEKPRRARRFRRGEGTLWWEAAGWEAASAEPLLEVYAGKSRCRGMVAAAPHDSREPLTTILARRMARECGIGLLVGHGTRDKGKRTWVNLDRPTERLFREGESEPGRAQSTRRAREWFEKYREGVAEASGASRLPVELIICVRSHADMVTDEEGERVCREVLEVSTKGFSPKELRAFRSRYEELLGEVAPIRQLPMMIDALDPRYEALGRTWTFKFTESDAKSNGFMSANTARRALSFFFPSFVITEEDMAAYSHILAELINWLREH